MEWVDGVKLTNKEGMAAAGHEITDFVDVGIECTLRQLLEHGYFHAGACVVHTMPVLLTAASGAGVSASQAEVHFC